MSTDTREAALTPDEVRALLRESVTVVKPGEILVLRCPDWFTPAQVQEIAIVVRYWTDDNAPDLKVMVIPHLDMAVAQPEDDAAFLTRAERVWPELVRREMRRQAMNQPRQH